jgi:hypothetical protein
VLPSKQTKHKTLLEMSLADDVIPKRRGEERRGEERRERL